MTYASGVVPAAVWSPRPFRPSLTLVHRAFRRTLPRRADRRGSRCLSLLRRARSPVAVPSAPPVSRRGSLDVNSHNHRGLNSTLIGREIVPRRHVNRGNGGTKWKANEIETATYLVCGRESERGSVHSALTNIPKRPSGATSRRAIPPRTINSHPRELISRLESCVLADRAR